MSSSTGGNGASKAPMPSNAQSLPETHQQQLLQPSLVSHYEQMLPLLHIAMHTNIFHTEHEDYPFWATALTYAVEKYMHRIAAVVPQSKIWARPGVTRKATKGGKKARLESSASPGRSSGAKRRIQNDATPVTASVTALPTDEAHAQHPGESATSSHSSAQESRRVQIGRQPTPSNLQEKPRAVIVPRATLYSEYDPNTKYDADGDVLENEEHMQVNAEASRTNPIWQPESKRECAHINEEEDPNNSPEYTSPSGQGSFLKKLSFLVEECDQSYDASFDSARTTDTGARKKVITDFGVLTPRDPSTTLDPARVYAACTKVRTEYGGIKTVPHGVPSDFVEEFSGADDDDDSDDDSDDEDRPDPPIVTPARGGFNLRPRTRSQATAMSSTNKDQPQADREALSWLERDMVFDESDDSPHDEVCNTQEAFEGLDEFAEFYIAILCEGKRGPSRSNKKGRFTKKMYKRLYKGIVSLMIQVLYLMTSDVWKHQNNVVGMVMVSDYWCWNEFERIPGRDSSEAKWQNYTDETRPYKTCNPWTRFVQWGSPASDQALANMMERVNQLYPAFSPSPTVDPTTGATPSASDAPSASGSSGPTAVATPADAPSSAEAPGSANLDTPSGELAESGEEIQAVEQYQETHEDELPHREDEVQYLPIEHDEAVGEPRALDIDITMHEIELASNAADPFDAPSSACSPSSRMEYRNILDSEVDDDPPSLMAKANTAAAGSSPDSRRLHEEGSHATFDDSAILRPGDDAGYSGNTSSKPPDGEEIQGHALDASTPIVPMRASGDSPNNAIDSSNRRQRDTASVQPRSTNAPGDTTRPGSLATPSASPGTSASAVPLAPHVQYNVPLRTAAQDIEPDSGPPGLYPEINDTGTNNSLTNTTGPRPLYGQNTQAALDGLAAISISNNESTNHSANATSGNNGLASVAAIPASVISAQGGGDGSSNSSGGGGAGGAGGAGGGGGGGGGGNGGGGTMPVGPENPLKRPEPDETDEEDKGTPRAPKKAKRAPAAADPPAQAGPGPSTQHTRGQAAPKRVRKKLTVAPSTRMLRSSNKTSKVPKKG